MNWRSADLRVTRSLRRHRALSIHPVKINLERVPMSGTLDRRLFLKSSYAMLLLPALGSRVDGAVRRNLKFAESPFQLGVASGDSAADGFVIWTRLAPKPLEGGGMPRELVEVAWEVATDEKMSQVVRRGTTVATPQLAHAVHVEVEGLKPDRWYWYRFKVGNEISPLGRTRTFPAASAEPDRLRFAFASCQHYEQGYYTAYKTRRTSTWPASRSTW